MKEKKRNSGQPKHTLETQRDSFQNRQRKAATGKLNKNAGCLDDLQVDKLKQLGFRFYSIKRIAFETRLNELIQWKAAHGHTRVPMMVRKEKHDLGRWAGSIRRLYHHKKLTAERVEALNKIQFDWTRRPRGYNGRDSSRRGDDEDDAFSDEY